MQLLAAGAEAGQGKEQLQHEAMLSMCMNEQRENGQRAAGSMRRKRGREENTAATKKENMTAANKYN
jgi:hypothetical protein